jgi:hypothetical protein
MRRARERISDPGGGGGAVTVYRVFNRRFDACHNPSNRRA